MDTKALCIESNYPGTKLFKVGVEADLSEIDYKSRHCWEIGGVNLKDIKELDDPRFYLQKAVSKDAEKIGKQLKAEIKEIEGTNKSLEAENNELKLKLAKLEGTSVVKEPKEAPTADEVEAIVTETAADAEVF